MPISNPGVKFRRHRLLSRKASSKRELVALLSLTAMVDMFTVLVVFLLQNYKTDNVVLHIPRDVVLPKAYATKELKPSHVVTISPDHILLGKEKIATFEDVKEQKEWMIKALYAALKENMAKKKSELELGLGTNLRKAIKDPEEDKGKVNESPEWSKVTVQASEKTDFLTVKKIMYTVTEAGASEINFAVVKKVEASAQGG